MKKYMKKIDFFFGGFVFTLSIDKSNFCETKAKIRTMNRMCSISRRLHCLWRASIREKLHLLLSKSFSIEIEESLGAEA